jgi:hypothetical protein
MSETDPASTHRELAIRTFNRSWELVDQADRDGDADAEMVAVAFASWWHWHQIGETVNKALADHQVAKVLALVGDGDLSLRFASRAFAVCGAEGWDDWKLVACHEGMARAHAVLGDVDQRDRHLEAARTLLARLGDDDAAVLRPQLAEIPGWAEPT